MIRAYTEQREKSRQLRSSRPADGDHDRIPLGLPGVTDARPPHGVVALSGEEVAVRGQVDSEPA
jgi:hypothetical protein